MLAVEIADFVQQQIKQEEWHEEEKVSEIHACDDAQRKTIDLNTNIGTFCSSVSIPGLLDLEPLSSGTMDRAGLHDGITVSCAALKVLPCSSVLA